LPALPLCPILYILEKDRGFERKAPIDTFMGPLSHGALAEGCHRVKRYVLRAMEVHCCRLSVQSPLEVPAPDALLTPQKAGVQGEY
jgi:hypothetical protein